MKKGGLKGDRLRRVCKIAAIPFRDRLKYRAGGRRQLVYQAMALARGADYFEEEFPELDRIERASLVPTGS